ncbi:hypothetical protein GCM10010528_29990 [Gordonia defluvii]|uniref:Mce-associated membrane protein n=1 Tax=Gordonia defluvii TaxID=283718 RepID=A0ABP6LP23_9ACTN
MSEMPPKKKRPRVAGQPRPGADRTGRPPSPRPPTGAVRRAPIERLDPGAQAPTGKIAKTAPTRASTTKSTAKTAGKGTALPAGDGEQGGSGKPGVTKSAPSRLRATDSATSRGPVFLAAAGIIALVVGLLGLWHPGAGNGEDKSFVDQSATSEVLGQIETAACAILGPRRGETIDKWIATSRAVLVGPARAEWEKQMPTNRDVIQQTQQTNECRVDAIGLRGLTGGGDGSTAQVLGSLVLSMNQGATAAGSIVVGIQYQVLRQDGKWKITRVDAWG